ncbi:MAG: phosphatidylserine/phosphatidylglycerophosphate/cardiolipin synthase family protein [Bacteriovoracaceae bacterium]|nr:phosphatidylserine/phosphatidylglycerophosphate/cardiolipin synthase family protein [Bacteriovoracaceae bacterium]
MKILVLLAGLMLACSSFSQSSAPTQQKLSFWDKLMNLLKVGDTYIYGDIDSYGLSFRALGKRSRFSWYGLRRKLRSEVKKSACQDLDCPDYYSDFSSITNSRKAKAKEIQWLTDMPTAFAKRWELISKAERSVYILTWGVYDDITGTTMAEKILDRLREVPDLDVRIIVDQKVAILEKHRAVLERLERESEGKVKIIRWNTTQYRLHVNHRKLMVTDGEHIILGGTNYGDNYSHLAGHQYWRDIDAYIHGFGVASQAQAQFAEVWNEQIIENEEVKHFTKIQTEIFPDDGDIPVQLLDHNPGNKTRNSDHNIVSGVYKLIVNAKKTIDIENAYVVLDPILREGLKKAVKKGVKVRLFTNSNESIDVPFLGNFVASSAKKALSYGVDVYLKKGTTLHSKFMIIDDKITMMGSHNLHPRSQALDGENVIVVFDKKLSLDLKKHFENGIAEALHPTKESDIDVHKALIDFIYGSLLFDHL